MKDREEACMVRHESAVALGSVGGEVATKFLRDYVQRPIDHNEVVVIAASYSPVLEYVFAFLSRTWELPH